VLRVLPLLAAATALPMLAGCAVMPFGAFMSPTDCMTRVMYFESIRSSADGMLAVGTVVMNRVADPKFPHSVCAVVGQPGQFAPGVMWLPMQRSSGFALAQDMATRVLRGERHPAVGGAEYFHTAGWSFPYDNMHYVLVAGGNAFYWKS
jgi:spore germination cell wall hydrolase CwlJ-like protein